MAHVYGSHGNSPDITEFSRHTAIFLRSALPLILLFLLASAGLQAFLHDYYIVAAFFAVFFVLLLLRYEELALTLALRLGRSGARAPSGQIAAMSLHELPDEYHVFHDLALGRSRIDHAVVGPGGFFVITVMPHPGRVTAIRESLRLNGWPFIGSLPDTCWRRSKALLHHLGLQQSGAIQVCPVLCFSRANVTADRLARGVLVAQASNLTRMILEHESPLSSDKILQLTGALAGMVRVRPGQCVRSGAGGEGLPVPTRSSRPVCTKCRHMPTDLEMDLFPDECPQCGRIYSLPAASALSGSKAAALHPSAAALLATCLTVVAGSGLLAYQVGLWELPGLVRTENPADTNGSGATIQAALESGKAETSSPSPVPDPALPHAQSVATVPGAAENADTSQNPTPQAKTAVAKGNAGGNGTAEAPPLPQSRSEAQAALSSGAGEKSDTVSKGGETRPHADTDSRIAPPQPVQSPEQADGVAATPPPGAPPAAAQNKSAQGTSREASPSHKGPAGLCTEGTLTVVCARPLTLWLINDQTMKRFGPYRAAPRTPLDLVLPKGRYSVTLVENGRRRRTSVSFLSDTGRLEF